MKLFGAVMGAVAAKHCMPTLPNNAHVNPPEPEVTEADSVFGCTNGLYGPHEKCGYFYQCDTNGRKWVMPTSRGLYWDASINAPNWIQAINYSLDANPTCERGFEPWRTTDGSNLNDARCECVGCNPEDTALACNPAAFTTTIGPPQRPETDYPTRPAPTPVNESGISLGRRDSGPFGCTSQDGLYGPHEKCGYFYQCDSFGNKRILPCTEGFYWDGSFSGQNRIEAINYSSDDNPTCERGSEPWLDGSNLNTVRCECDGCDPEEIARACNPPQFTTLGAPLRPVTDYPTRPPPTPVNESGFTPRQPDEGPFGCTSADGLYGPHEKCGYFYQCDMFGKKWIMPCTEGFYWDATFNGQNRIQSIDYSLDVNPTCERGSEPWRTAGTETLAAGFNCNQVRCACTDCYPLNASVACQRT